MHLVWRFKTEDPEVKRQLVELLGIWSKKYKGQPGMTSIEQLYTAGAGRINVVIPWFFFR